jgi:ring-1,2-phenylacetyl-CoA epoxidase subunit PaaC
MPTKTAVKPAENRQRDDAVRDLLFRLADDCLVLGHRDSEWTGLGPILEEDIAFSSMAQDKIGHALALYTLLHEMGEADPDTLAFSRGPDEYRCSSLAALPRGDWAFSLVRQFFFAEADAVRFAALSRSTFEPLAKLARKLRGEVKYHQMHGRMWVKKLGRASDESRQRLQSAVSAAFGHALGIFEPTRFDETLAHEGVCPTEAELCAHWRDEVEPLMEESFLRAPNDASPVLGGRAGRHGPALAALLESMQRVFRLDPTAKW